MHNNDAQVLAPAGHLIALYPIRTSFNLTSRDSTDSNSTIIHGGRKKERKDGWDWDIITHSFLRALLVPYSWMGIAFFTGWRAVVVLHRALKSRFIFVTWRKNYKMAPFTSSKENPMSQQEQSQYVRTHEYTPVCWGTSARYWEIALFGFPNSKSISVGFKSIWRSKHVSIATFSQVFTWYPMSYWYEWYHTLCGESQAQAEAAM